MTLKLAFRFDADASALKAETQAARQDVEQLTATVNAAGSAGVRAGDGLAQAGKGASAAAGAAKTAANDVQRLAREFDDIKASVDPAYEALRRYQQQQLRVSEAVAAGAVSQRDAAQVITQAAARYQAAASGGTSAFRSVGQAAQQAGYQIGDFAVQVASGGNVVVAAVQQLSQLLGFFGSAGAVAGAAVAIAGGLYLAFSNIEDATSAAREAQERLAEALKSGKTEAEAAAIAENVLADALERSQKSSGDLTDMSFIRISRLRQQQVEALNAAQAERELQKAQIETAIAEERRRIAGLSDVQRSRDRMAGRTLDPEDGAEVNRRREEVKRLEEGIAALQAQIAKLSGVQDEAFRRDFAGPLQAQVDHLRALTEAYGQGSTAVQDVIVQEKIRQEQARAGVAADSERGREIARQVADRERQTKVVADLAKAEQERTAQAERDRQESERLAVLRVTTIEDLQSELDYQTRLTEAHRQGEEAVLAVEAARKAELIVQRLKLDGTEIEVGLIDELVRKIAEQQAATQGVIDVQQEAERAAKQLGQEQKRAAEEASRVIERIADIGQEKLGDILYDYLRREHVDFLDFFEQTFLRAIADVSAAALRSQLLVPFATQVVGLAPELFGLSGPAAAAAQSRSGGLLGQAGSFVGNQVAGQAWNAFGFNPFSQVAAGFGNLGANWAAGGAGAALFGQAGGSAAAAGVAPAWSGLTNAPTAGLFGQGGALTGAGALGIAGAIAAAIGIAYTTGIIGPNPSVGPVGIADFSPGRGRGREFDAERGLDPFTADNGGDGEGMRPIAEAVAELIADSADRFGATIDGSLRFRIANYASPQGGSGRSQGFEVNAFLQSETERRIAEGLTQEEAVKEALAFAVREAFAFDREVLADVSQTISGDTADELLGQLQAALDFDDLTTALRDAGEAIDANTLAVQEQILALQRQGEEAGRKAADATLERFDTLTKLFAPPVAETAAAEVEATYDRDTSSITAGDRTFRVRNTGDEFGRFEVTDAAGEVIGAFAALEEALDAVARRVEETTEAIADSVQQPVDDALRNRNVERIRDAIQVTRAGVERDIGRITGSFEEPEIGVYGADYIEGKAALRAYGEQLADVNDAFRRQAEAFPELAAEIDQWLIDIPSTLAAAGEELRNQVAERMREDLDVEDRALRGAGAVDTIRGLVETRDTRLTDAATLGVDATLVHRNFKVAVEKAFDGLDIDALREIRENVTDPVVQALADTAIAEKVTAFNQSIGDQLLALQSPKTAQLVTLNRQYEEDLAYANDNGGDVDAVMRLYQEQARRLVEGTDDVETAMRNTVSAYQAVLPDLRRFRSQLDTDAALSTLTTDERYALLLADFKNLKADAEGGDVEAQAQLEEAGRELLQVSRLVNAANDNYEADRRLVMSAVDASIATADRELQVAQDQLSALNGIDARLADLADALSGGLLGNQPTSNLILAQASGYSGSFGNGGFGQAAQAYGASRVAGLGNRPELNAQLAYVTGFTGTFGGGGSGPSFQEYVRSSAVSEIQREAARIILRQNGETPGFVDGGYVLNGVPGVDSVTAKLAGREFVVRAPAVAQIGVPTLSHINQTGRLPDAGGTDAAVLREVGQAIVAELRQQGDASRLQSRDDADHVADQVGRLHGALAPLASLDAHERARPRSAA